KVTYKGKLDALIPVQRKKLDAKLAKLGKQVDGKEEREAHLILTSERKTHRAEITVNYYDHPLVGVGSSHDLFTSVTSAIDKVDKQVRKVRAKWREVKRGPEQTLRTRDVSEPGAEAAEEEEPQTAVGQVFRANDRANQKPLTIEEALLVIEDGRDYVVYRDSESDRLSVLLRRRDGNFDLVEA
ncbi:MAG: HPF/RaiA family ribosome-associated protein, partial [bacterium]|nr:HPF/RaiA family ribosome-associated protein [bacterium]